MKKKDLIDLLLSVLRDWEKDYGADLDGPNGGYYDELVEILTKEDK